MVKKGEWSRTAVVFLATATLAVWSFSQVKERELTHDVTVTAVNVAVTVQDRAGRYVTNLIRGDFSVFENGAKQEITYFQHSFEAPISLTVLLDVSGSMALQDRLGEGREALHLFTGGLLRPRDEVSLLLFADGNVEVAVPFTNDRTPFFEALAEAKAYGQTALNDAIAVSPEFADKGRNDKRALLLLTDGIENDSLVSSAQALEIARRVNVPIYILGYKIPASEQMLKKYKRSAALTQTGIIETLTRFSEATGGRAFFPGTPAELAAALGSIHRELGHHYILGYSTNQNPPDEYRNISVVTSNKRYRVRARKGY